MFGSKFSRNRMSQRRDRYEHSGARGGAAGCAPKQSRSTKVLKLVSNEIVVRPEPGIAIEPRRP
jgi:hypothetical protein